jgi:hypothetical protein
MHEKYDARSEQRGWLIRNLHKECERAAKAEREDKSVTLAAVESLFSATLMIVLPHLKIATSLRRVFLQK